MGSLFPKGPPKNDGAKGGGKGVMGGLFGKDDDKFSLKKTLFQKVADAPTNIASFAKQTAQKKRDWRGVPLFLHLLADLVGRIPGPILLTACMWLTLYCSAYGSTLVGNIISATKAKNNRFLRFIKGHDAAFGIFYAINALWLAIIVLMLTLVARVPLSVVFGILFSAMGVVGSVAMEMVCSTADEDGFREAEGSRDACLRRRLFLHGAMGAGVASVVLIMPKVSSWK
jgi:hypothetical protein